MVAAMVGNIVTKRKRRPQITYTNAIQLIKHDGIGTRTALIALKAFLKNEANLNFLLLHFFFSTSLDSLAVQEAVAFVDEFSPAFRTLSMLIAQANKFVNTLSKVKQSCAIVH
ncbi:hypothetical protein T4D_16202 [Trichinella pseudospiralis]|uniref:Uncharacterized protein n=1 Tax=Trichinella pseudospiralis TaxID=6337 RepID=A0A0V1G3I7_TRIPS|nr:hypothetical protein T4D_16202 [Trichinella pseudospiralis]